MIKYAGIPTLIVLALSLSGLSCTLFAQPVENQTSSSSTNTTSGNLLTTIAPDQINDQATANYNKAVEQATAWQPDAVLYGLVIKLLSSLKVNQASETYVFGSDADPKVWYTVSAGQQTGKLTRAWVMRQDFLPEVQNPVKIQYWKTNYVAALQAAEKVGGSAFRDTNPNATVNLTLAVGDPKNWLWWNVEYQAPLSGNVLKFKIDTNSGKAYNQNGEPLDQSTQK